MKHEEQKPEIDATCTKCGNEIWTNDRGYHMTQKGCNGGKSCDWEPKTVMLL